MSLFVFAKNIIPYHANIGIGGQSIDKIKAEYKK